MSSNPDRETEPMSLRSSDPHTPIFKITREITPWQLGTAAASIAIFAATVWFSLRASNETMTTIATDVKQVLAAQRAAELTTIDLQYQVRDLTKRVIVLESKKEQP